MKTKLIASLFITFSLIALLFTAAFAQGNTVTVTLTPDERAAVKWAADQQGQTVAQYLQDRVRELARSYAQTRDDEQARRLEAKRARVAADVQARVEAIRAKARADEKAVLDAVPDPIPTPSPEL